MIILAGPLRDQYACDHKQGAGQEWKRELLMQHEIGQNKRVDRDQINKLTGPGGTDGFYPVIEPDESKNCGT